MSCQISRNKQGNITGVTAPNGEPSKLYSDLVNLAKENIDQFKDDPYVNKLLEQDLIRDASPEELALAAWSKTYTPEFKEQYNWSNEEPNLTNIQGILFNQGSFSQQNDNIYFSLGDDNINYALKAVDILMSDKAVEIFNKGQKNNWNLNKILTELQVPKEQKQIILGLDVKDREEIILELASNYSFSIKVNTTQSTEVNRFVPADEYLPFDGYSPEETRVLQNSSYYANLTVSGGTNYTENEIATPLITPNIKGHAQFSTDNGIGWFRSDDRNQEDSSKVINSDYPEGFENLGGTNRKGNGITDKTRRVLELQSDLFQKGRTKKDLIKSKYQSNTSNTILDPNNYHSAEAFNNAEEIELNNIRKELNNINLTHKEAVDYINKLNTNSSKNQFLQLLNKKNNWVTFFVKSIIQDSAKKGYEKVLFPKGDTAAKIEGHETLEEFKREKEARIKQLEKELNEINEDKYQEELGPFAEDTTPRKNAINKELKNLKQELADVESGQTQLSSIANFYEDTITNILKKNGYNPTEITDEFGNKWNEVTIDPTRDLGDILFQLGTTKNKTNKEILPKLREFVNSQGYKVEDLSTYIQDYEARTGRKWEQDNAEGLIDFVKKAIAIKEGKEVAFNEEAAHLAIALSPKGERFERALEKVVGTEMYRLYANKYEDAYTKLEKQKPKDQRLDEIGIERKVRIEILGKLLLETLVNEQNAKKSFGTWLVRYLKQLWNNFIGQFKTNELSNFLTEVSHNINLQNSEFFNNSLDNQGTLFALSEEATEPIDPATKLRDQILHDMKLRLKRLKGRKLELTAAKVKKQIEDIELLEAEIGLRNFVEFLAEDLNEAIKYIEKVKRTGELPNDLTLGNLRDFISFYKYSLDQLDSAINAGDVKLDSNPKENKRLKKIIDSELRQFKIVKDYLDRAISNRFKANAKVEFEEGELDFDIDKLFDEKANDINGVQLYFGTSRDVGEAFTRIIYRLVGKLTITVRQLSNTYGKQLINKVYKEFGGDTTISRFAERDVNGKTTGYYVNPFKMGGFNKSLEEMREKKKLAESEKEATEIKEEWLKNNVERRLTQEYYDLRATLSDATNKALDGVNASIDAILNKYKSQDLTVDLTEITEEDWTKLKQAKIAKKSLANLYNLDNTKKSGEALDIAEELKAYNEKYWENVNYKPNMTAFEEAKTKVAPNKRKLWYDRNTEIQYSKEFWELFNQLGKRDFGDEYSELNEERLELMRPFRVDNQELDIDSLPEAIKDRVKVIDKRLIQIVESTPLEDQSGLKFSDIANITKTDAYYAARTKAKAEGKEDQWVEDNHYYTAKGKRRPHSYWTKFIPKKKEHIERVPTREWSELDPESNWHNKNYDPNWEGYQPKVSKWKNNKYDKISDKDREYLAYLIKEKHEADRQMGIQPNYRMPQLSQSFMDLMYNRSGLLSGMKELVKESVSRRADDDVLYGDPDNEYRSDGTKVNYVARKYTRPIEDPSVISTDLLSSLILYKEAAINYERMTKAAPMLENIQEQLGNRQFKRGKRIIKGKESDTYRLVREFIDAEVYGIMMSEGTDINIPLIGKVNTSKLTDLANAATRNINLIFNTFSILSNITGGFINANIDRIVGRYSTQTSNNKAIAEFTKSIGSVVAEYNRPIKSNKMSQVLEFFNVTSSNEELFDNLDKTSIKRLTPSDLTYVGWNQGGYFLRAVPALAVMFNQRYDGTSFIGEQQWLAKNEGKTKNDYYKFTSIYDMLEVKDNSIQVKEKYKEIVTQDYLAKLNAIITQRITQVDGNVTPLDRTIAHRHVWLKLVTTHRGWLIDGLARRFKGESKNLLTGYKEVGYHRYFFTEFLGKAFFTADRKFTLKQIFQAEFWNTLEPHQKEAAYRSLLELAIMTAMIVIAKAVNNMADDDEELEWAAYLTNRTLMEVSALSPSPMAIMELTQIINSPIAGVRQIETLMDIGDIFSGEEIESGKYEGLSERQRLLIKLMPGVKGFYGTRDPGASNQFLKSKSLRWIY